jgi:large subunit ribosomal protein L25
MAEEFLLNADDRTIIGKQVNAMRRAGSVPAIIYGNHIETPLPIKVEEKTLKQIIAKAGRNRLIKLMVGNSAPRLVLTREVQRNSMTGIIVHVDFQEVSMTEKVTTPVPLVLVGTSPAVNRGEGLLIHGINTVEIRALPMDLVAQIDVDVTALNALNQSLFVRDLKPNEKIEILTPGDEMVAKVVPLKEEVIAVEAPAAVAEVEVIKKGKIEEEGAEGEAAAGGEAKKEEKK